MLEAVISGNSSQNIANALVSMMVQDNDSTPIFLGYAYQNIQAGGQATIFVGFQIPYDAVLGDYSDKVNIFTLLPSQGGVAIDGAHAEAHFTVS